MASVFSAPCWHSFRDHGFCNGYDADVARESRTVREARAVHLNVLLLANRSLDQLEDICRSEGLTHAQYVALWTLCLADDPDAGVPVGAVADGLLNRAADATRLVDRLEKAGLAERMRNPADRRGVLVRATPLGHERFEAVTPKLQEFHASQWANLTATELRTLGQLVAKALWTTTPVAAT
jgi:DNA-binding MarR family transcriptional regulator